MSEIDTYGSVGVLSGDRPFYPDTSWSLISASYLVLRQGCIDGCSVTVVLRNKTQYAGNGHSPCQVL